MAWRIHEHILRGEIDNRIRGRVTGRLWLTGIDQPLVLDLEDNCHPDLAGCLLLFENPQPVPFTTRPPAAVQRGTAGDITAARKVRVFDLPFEEAYAMIKRGERPPEHLANSLYLEWFSPTSGRVVIESADYRLQISEPVWRFTAEELADRERRFTEGSDTFALEIHADGTVQEWDEFRHEQLLRESDTLNEKYRRLLEKYADHPDAEELIAHEMGWERFDQPAGTEKIGRDDGRAEAGEDQDGPDDDDADDRERSDEIARMNEICEAALNQPNEDPLDPAKEGIDWVRNPDGRVVHPLYQQARHTLGELLDELRAAGQLPECDDPALEEFVDQSMTLTAKLAAATGPLARGFPLDPGHTIALLKRTLEIHNTTLAAAERFAGTPYLPAARFAHYRDEFFALREEILALITRLRGV